MEFRLIHEWVRWNKSMWDHLWVIGAYLNNVIDVVEGERPADDREEGRHEAEPSKKYRARVQAEAEESVGCHLNQTFTSRVQNKSKSEKDDLYRHAQTDKSDSRLFARRECGAEWKIFFQRTFFSVTELSAVNADSLNPDPLVHWLLTTIRAL